MQKLIAPISKMKKSAKEMITMTMDKNISLQMQTKAWTFKKASLTFS